MEVLVVWLPSATRSRRREEHGGGVGRGDGGNVVMADGEIKEEGGAWRR